MTTHTHNQDRLTIVGSGITALVTAYSAINNGLEITIISKAPDPRQLAGKPVDHQGSTFDGMDQRYITLFEGHPYLDFLEYVQKTYPDISGDFMRVVERGGMLGKAFSEFSISSQEWLSKRFKENQLLLNGDEEAITRVRRLFESYVKENRTAMSMWYDLFSEMLEKMPELLGDLSLSIDGVLRIYDNEEVLNESVATHRKEGVLKRVLSPRQLKDEYPAYQAGVENGFIQGGAIEVFGLTFGVKTLAGAILNDLERRGASFLFNTEVSGILLDENEIVEGIILSDGSTHVSTHYAFHTGAFGGPLVFAQIAEANQQLAAVEGYWIEMEQAEVLLKQMGQRPMKMHGKQPLSVLLDKVEKASREWYLSGFSSLGVDLDTLSDICPTIDFNNMPIRKNGMSILGCGSGYTFLGLAERSQGGRSMFPESTKAQEFTQLVMQLALEALYGKGLLESGSIKVRKRGCKRSWTPMDNELDVNRVTKDGGLLMIHGGGNTGSTTKAPFISHYILKKLDEIALNPERDHQELQAVFNGLRTQLADVSVSPQQWAEKELVLQRSVKVMH